MGNGNSLINFGDLSKPANTLIEKVSDAVGGYFRPHQIKRVAEAEAEAKKIQAKADIEISELQQRAVQRFIAEEAKKQENIESITSKAILKLNESSEPEDIEDDWIVNFFDKCRLISDEEMQELWSEVLAGEANTPQSYSKRTVNFLSSLDKQDAILFQNLCNFNWNMEGLTPLIYNVSDDIYIDHKITFDNLKHLDNIGLISYSSMGYIYTMQPQKATVHYYSDSIILECKEEKNLKIGRVLLSQIGEELAPICGSKPIDGFVDYVLDKWMEEGIITSCELKNFEN